MIYDAIFNVCVWQTFVGSVSIVNEIVQRYDVLKYLMHSECEINT